MTFASLLLLRPIEGSAMALKISPSDYLTLETALKAAVERNPGKYEAYKDAGLSDMRYNWDMVRASGFNVCSLYHYLNDDHINSALAKILGNSGLSAKKALAQLLNDERNEEHN